MLSQYVHTAARLGNAAICTTHLTRALHNYNVTPKVTQTSYSAAAAGLSRIMGVPQLHAFCHFNTKERKKNTHIQFIMAKKKGEKKEKGPRSGPFFPVIPGSSTTAAKPPSTVTSPCYSPGLELATIRPWLSAFGCLRQTAFTTTSLAWCDPESNAGSTIYHMNQKHPRIQSAYLLDPDVRLKAPGTGKERGNDGGSSTRGACRRLAFRSAPFWKLHGGLVW